MQTYLYYLPGQRWSHLVQAIASYPVSVSLMQLVLWIACGYFTLAVPIGTEFAELTFWVQMLDSNETHHSPLCFHSAPVVAL